MPRSAPIWANYSSKRHRSVPGKVFQESLVPFLFVPTQKLRHTSCLLSLPSHYTQMSGEKGNQLLNCSRGTAYKDWPQSPTG